MVVAKKPNQPQAFDLKTAAGVQRFAEAHDDFGFEMRVADAVTSTLDVPLVHGATYTDDVTSKTRQFDFRFVLRHERKALYFAVECKNIDPTNPIMVCGRPSVNAENFHDVIVSRGGGNARTSKAKANLYLPDQFVGKSILRQSDKGRTGESEVYERWSQALSSAHELVVEAARVGAPRDLSNFGVVFPYLVVPDNTLWTVSYDKAGTVDRAPTPASHCRYFVAHRVQVPHIEIEVCLSHIDFFTLSGFRERLNQLKSIAQDWDDWIPSDIRRSFVGES